MASCKLMVSLTLVVIMAISYESFPWIGVQASDVLRSCHHNCNKTSESRHHNRYKIYGYPFSTNTRRVLAVLSEKGLSYETITVDLISGEEKKPRFLSINPFGQVPVFLDGDLKLSESRAISEYIATVHRRGSQLLNHKSHKARGTQTMWMTIESFEFDPPASVLTQELAINPRIGLKPDYKIVNETEPKLEKVLDIYEERLKRFSFLAGNSFSLADLYHLPNIQSLMGTSAKRLFEKRPSVRRWVAEITARPAWKKACDEKAWYDKNKN